MLDSLGISSNNSPAKGPSITIPPRSKLPVLEVIAKVARPNTFPIVRVDHMDPLVFKPEVLVLVIKNELPVKSLIKWHLAEK